MAYTADITIKSPDQQTIALVEVFNVGNLDLVTATAIRRNLIDLFALPTTPYLLIVSQEYGYLWNHGDCDVIPVEPTEMFSMEPVMARFASDHPPGVRMQAGIFDYVVVQWLSHLAWSHHTNGEYTRDQLPLEGSVFANAIAHSNVLMEAVI